MAFAIVFAVASLVLLARIFVGPFAFVHSPLNAESIAALSFILALLWRSGSAPKLNQRVPPIVLGVLAAVVAIAFLPGVTAPLLHDSYLHIMRASKEAAGAMLDEFVHPPRTGAPFFRPIGFVSYWIDYQWAGFHPAAWHLWNLAVHLVNCALVWLLARRLSLSPAGSTLAALVFALHGSRPEVVAWAAARFDLLSTFFCLIALLNVERTWLVAIAASLALLSKEAAFSLPLLILLMRAFQPNLDKGGILKSAATVAVLCAIYLAYRTWFLGGIGGYTTATGAPAIFHFSALRSAKGLFYREWALLFFPINWSIEPEIWLKIAAIPMIATFWLTGKSLRRGLLASLAFVLLAVLPAQHLLLVGADLSGSRILYLPSTGLALFWGFAMEGSSFPLALAACLVVFQAAALEHNLLIWRDVAFRSQKICQQGITPAELPATLNGVVFLSNGFPQCVEMNSVDMRGK